MMTGIKFPTTPLKFDEERTIESSRETPIKVAIECFTEPPTPAQLQPCPTCGTFQVTKTAPFTFTAPRQVFEKRTGYLRVVLTDGAEESAYNIEVINTDVLTDEDKKVIKIVTQKLKEQFVKLDDRVNYLSRQIAQRETAGLILKVSTGLIGILVASGFLDHVLVQALGVVVLIIVMLEQTYGNLEKLKTQTSGRNAYSRIRREVEGIHNDQILLIIRDKVRRPMDSANRLIELNRQLMKLLSNTQQEVETAMENKQLALLDRLTLTDQAKQITSGGQTGALSAG